MRFLFFLLVIYISVFFFSIAFAQIPIDGLVAYYPFNGDANDASGNGNHGTTYGGITWLIDRFGNVGGACGFNQVDSYIKVQNSPTLQLTSRATFSCWVKIAEGIDYYPQPFIFAKGATPILYADYAFCVFQYDHQVFEITDSSGITEFANIGLTLQRGQWKHIAFTYDAPQLTMYVDGVNSYRTSISDSFRVSTEPLFIGIRYDTPNLPGLFKGCLDDIRIYNRVLNDSGIKELYHEGGWDSLDRGLIAYYPFNGDASDQSGNDHHGTIYGNPTPSADRFGNLNRAYQFDGNDDYITISNIPLGDQTTPKTFCAWFKLNSLDTEDWVTPFCQRRTPDEGMNRWLIEAVSNYIEFAQSVNNTPSWPPSLLNVSIDATNYHFLVESFSNEFDGGKCKVYLDGNYKGSLSTQNLFDFGTDLWIQREQGWSGIANRKGSIDDIRIYNRVLSESEIQALYHEGGWIGNPKITVTSPNGGENWVAGSQKNITWDATAVDNVKIELSTDNGANWLLPPIISSTPASTGSYSYTVPPYFSRTCKIKISDVSNTSLNDSSDRTFNIIHTPIIIIPGIMGSGLFEDANIDNHLIESERRWVPKRPSTFFKIDLSTLFLNKYGIGENPNIKCAPIRGDESYSIMDELDYDILPILDTRLMPKPGPLKHYKGLVYKLTNNGYNLDHFTLGYTSGDDLFIFPYDWRKDISDLGVELKTFIDTVLSWTGADKIDIVGHSMGGLLIKECVSQIDHSHIRKVIFLATPHQGVAIMPNTFCRGVVGGPLDAILDREQVKSLARNMTPVYQLTPKKSDIPWLAIAKNGTSPKFSQTYDYTIDWLKKRNECNSDLLGAAETWKNSRSTYDFSGIETYNVYCGLFKNTPSQIVYIEKLKKFGTMAGDLEGDKTVPLYSAANTGITSPVTPYALTTKVEHDNFGNDETVCNYVYSVLNPSAIALLSKEALSPTTQELSNSSVQVNASGVSSLHIFDKNHNHTGTLTDTTWEEGIPTSYFNGEPPFHVGGSISVVLPRAIGYTVNFQSISDTQEVDYSIYDLSSGELLQASFFDSIQINPNVTAICSVAVHNEVPILYIDNNSDGHGDSIITPTSTGAQASEINIQSGWNLVSIPRIILDKQKNLIFPSAISDAFKYEATYISKDSLENGIGYWLKYAAAESLSLIGVPLHEDSISVKEGWNLIGSISDPIVASSITSDPPNITTSDFFGYTSSYVTSDTIYPGFGYWVKVNQDGKLILSAGGSVALTNRIKIVPTSDLPPLPPQNEDNAKVNLPKQYSLTQNYPNPFNPSTSIRYGVPSRSHVKLEIFNTLGQKVATLVDAEQDASFYNIEWNANVSSGMYFYRLEATDINNPTNRFVQTKKMILLR